MAEAMLAEFECPICVSYMSPPSIRQCVQGHLFCSQCFEIIENCAICRSEKSDNYCLTLEKVHSLLTFPCRYKDEGDGCGYVGKSDELAIHETFCLPMKCPLKFLECQWRGKLSNMLEHCKLKHEGDIFEADRMELSLTWAKVAQRELKVVSVFDTAFLCWFQIKPDCRTELSIVHIGKPSIADQFFVNVAFTMKHKQTVELIPEDFEKRTLLIRNKCMTFRVYPKNTYRRGSRISCLLNIFKEDSQSQSTTF